LGLTLCYEKITKSQDPKIRNFKDQVKKPNGGISSKHMLVYLMAFYKILSFMPSAK
jgi:hypothetical protein